MYPFKDAYKAPAAGRDRSRFPSSDDIAAKLTELEKLFGVSPSGHPQGQITAPSPPQEPGKHQHNVHLSPFAGPPLNRTASFEPDVNLPPTPPGQNNEEFDLIKQYTQEWYNQPGAHYLASPQQPGPPYKPYTDHLRYRPYQPVEHIRVPLQPLSNVGNVIPMLSEPHRNDLVHQHYDSGRPPIGNFAPPAPPQARSSVRPEIPIPEPPIQQWPTHYTRNVDDQSELARSYVPAHSLYSGLIERPGADPRQEQDILRQEAAVKAPFNPSRAQRAPRKETHRRAPYPKHKPNILTDLVDQPNTVKEFVGKPNTITDLVGSRPPAPPHPDMSSYTHTFQGQYNRPGDSQTFHGVPNYHAADAHVPVQPPAPHLQPRDPSQGPVPYVPPQHPRPYLPPRGSSRRKVPYAPMQDPARALPPRDPSPPPVPKELPPPRYMKAAQPITKTYEEYEWPVLLYRLDPSKGYDNAQSFVEDLFRLSELYEKDSNFKWHSHTTQGFIEGDDRLLFIVLHNAANPFTWGEAPESTTTVGVYGRYGHLAEKEIYWTTFAPDIRSHLDNAQRLGHFFEKYLWHKDMKPKERRFHQSYWMAANMLPMGRMLNHGKADKKAHDAWDEYEDKEEFTKADLQDSWQDEEVSEENAAKAWEKILKDNEARPEVEYRYEHGVTGCSEWENDALWARAF
ncbi:hypothetical protein N0V83_006762 [Neocucurbitaria cava]|uniref:Uncharacterized protein n=1 Tax=Neocucurbitaria cava TaxID=798079 RepID=A0A9W8Y6M4_9PLEO|nr:hypothetical protein N0V83_006762 [Neocucurbitaria cava]